MIPQIFGLVTYPGADNSMVPWVPRLARLYEAGALAATESQASLFTMDYEREVAEFVAFYAAMDCGPFAICPGTLSLSERKVECAENIDVQLDFEKPSRLAFVNYFGAKLDASLRLSPYAHSPSSG